VFVLRKLFQTATKIRDWYRNRAGDVTGFVLTRWARVEDDDIVRSGTLEQLRHRDWFGTAAITEVVAKKSIELCQAPLRDCPECTAEVGDGGIRETVVNELALLAGFDEGRSTEALEVLRDVGNGGAQLARQRVDRAFTLPEKL
jgi:hypothetical protein